MDFRADIKFQAIAPRVMPLDADWSTAKPPSAILPVAVAIGCAKQANRPHGWTVSGNLSHGLNGLQARDDLLDFRTPPPPACN